MVDIPETGQRLGGDLAGWLDPVELQFGKAVREARAQRGLSQAAAAERMRELGYKAFTQQVVTRIETGSRSVRLGEGLALARVTGAIIGVELLSAHAESWAISDAADALEQTSEKLAGAAERLRELADQL